MQTRGEPAALWLGSAREVGTRAPPQSSERPQEDEAEDHDPDPDLDHAAARFASFGDEPSRRDRAAGRPEQAAVRGACEQETDRLVLGDEQIAVGSGWTADDDRAADVALHALIDLDGQQPLRISFRRSAPLGDDSPDDRGIGGVEALAQGCVDADARPCLAREREGRTDGSSKRYRCSGDAQTSTSSASP